MLKEVLDFTYAELKASDELADVQEAVKQVLHAPSFTARAQAVSRSLSKAGGTEVAVSLMLEFVEQNALSAGVS